MSLDIGKLVGYLELDDTKFGKVLEKMPEKIRGAMGLGMAASAAVGVAVAGALVGGISDAMNMEKANAKLSAQLNLTAEESGRMGRVAGTLYANNYGESIEDVNGAIDSVITSIGGMRDANESTVADMTGKIMSMSTAYEVEVGRMAQVVGQMISTGLAKDADEGADLVAAAMSKVPAAVREDVLDAADEYGPFFAQLGLSGEQAMAALVAGSEKGMYGIDKTGDALKELTIRATDMSTTSVAAYEAAGLNAEDMSAKFLAGGAQGKEGMQQLVDGLLSIKDPVAQANAAIGLFGTPLEDLGTDQIPTFLASLGGASGGMDDVAGAADRLDSKLNSGVSNSWDGLIRQFQSFAAGAGAEVLPILQGIMDWAQENPGAIKAMAIVVGILALAFGVLTAAMWAASLTPIALIIGAIVLAIGLLIAGIYLLVTNWDTVWGSLTGVVDGFVGWITGVFDGFLGWWGGVWDGFLGFLSDAWTNIKAFASAALQGLLQLFFTYNPVGILIANWGSIVDWFKELPGKILDGILAGWTAVTTWFSGIPAAIGEFLAGAGEWLSTTGYDLLVGLLAGILLGMYLVGEFFTNLPGVIWGFITGAATWLLQAGIDILTGLRDGIVSGWTTIITFFTEMPGKVQAFLNGAGVWLATTGVDIITGLWNGITQFWAGVAAWFIDLPNKVKSFLSSAVTWLVTTGSDILAGLQAGYISYWTGVAAWFQAMPGKVKGFLAGAVSWLISTGSNILSGLLSGINSGWSAVSSFFTSIPGKVTSALGNAGSWLVSAGRNIMDGLRKGITDAAGAVFDKISQLASDVKDKFANLLQIHSPSRVFRGFGRNIGEGLMLGLADVTPDVGLAVNDFSQVAMPAATTSSQAAAFSGPLVDARTYVSGNVGWSKDEVEKTQSDKMNRAISLVGLDEFVGVS